MRKLQHRRLHAVHLLCCHILRPCGEFQCLLRWKRQLDRAAVVAEKRLRDSNTLQRAAPRQPLPARVSDREGCFHTIQQMTTRDSRLQRSPFIGNAKIFRVPLL